MHRMIIPLLASVVIGIHATLFHEEQSCTTDIDCSNVHCDTDILSTCVGGKCACKEHVKNGVLPSYNYTDQLNANIHNYCRMHFKWIKDVLKQNDPSKPVVHFPKKRIVGQMSFKEKPPRAARFRKERSVRHSGSEFEAALTGTNTNTAETEMQVWLAAVKKTNFIPHNLNQEKFFNQWDEVIRLFSTNDMRSDFSHRFPKLPVVDALSAIGTSDAFHKLFWPFVYEISFMNQQLALFGLTEERVAATIQKGEFFAALEREQKIKIPYAEDKLVYSFDDEELVIGMVNSGVIQYNSEFVESGDYKFNASKQKEIAQKVDQAMDLIKETMPELHRSIIQMVGCLAFYKAEEKPNIGGTASSALGVVWLDPSDDVLWPVPYYAEQIIHEYIHTCLFYAEFAHGTYKDFDKLTNAQVMSTIRKELRAYDKSLHAAYVSVGLMIFNALAGFRERAETIVESVPSALEELVAVNGRQEVLTQAGSAILEAMVDIMTIIRLMN